jgi:ribosomal protein L40E
MEMLVIGIVAIVAFGVVLLPLFRRRHGVEDSGEFADDAPSSAPGTMPPVGAGPVTPVAPAPVDPAPAAARADGDVEAEVLRYRAALRAGTLCRKCGAANPDGSQFCGDCGARLPLADAKEFE